MDTVCYFCGAEHAKVCPGCGFPVCANCDNETLIEDGSPHDVESHLDTDDSGYADVPDEEAE